jgi:NADPH:quinone reductase-like Zn-dependent oxidoreductase
MWHSLLSESGFSGLDVVIGNSENEAEHYCSTMVSTATPKSQSALPPTDIILHNVSLTEKSKILTNAIQMLTKHAPTVTELENFVPEDKFYIFLVGEPFLHHPTEESYNKVRSLLTTVRGVLWVYQEDCRTPAAAEAGFVLGLARTVRNENPLILFATLGLDLDPKLSRKPWDAAAFDTIVKVLAASFRSTVDSNCGDLEYRERQGVVEIPRIVYDPHVNASDAAELGHTVHTQEPLYQIDRRFHLEVEIPGLLDSLHFVEEKNTKSVLPDEFVELDVKSCGVNFRDVMVATGHIDQAELGTECSGIITAVGSGVKHLKLGDRVFGWAANTYAQIIRCPAAGLHVMPDGLTFAAASSLPNVYCTVIYALVDIANLRTGEIVLIHAAAGGVGQAAIMLCQHLGAEIFVTVGTLTKKTFLMEKYGLPEQNIFFSRDESFAEHVMARTNGSGVDVILNSLAGEQLRHSWDCIAPFGRFLEIGKRDMTLNTRLEMKPFFRNVIFASIDMVLVRDCRIEMIQRLLSETCKLLDQGAIVPVQPLHIVSFANIEVAFRKLQNGQEYGKFVAIPSASDVVKVSECVLTAVCRKLINTDMQFKARPTTHSRRRHLYCGRRVWWYRSGHRKVAG